MDWAVSINDDPEARARAVCDVIQRVLAPTGGVSLITWDRERGEFGRSVSTIPGQPTGLGSRRVRRKEGATSSIVRDNRVMLCPRVSANEARENPMLGEFRIESYVGAPVLHRGDCVGAVYLLNRHPERPPSHEIELLTRLAQDAGAALAEDIATSRVDGETDAVDAPTGRKSSVWDGIFSDPITGSAIVDEAMVVRSWSGAMSRVWGVEGSPPAGLDRVFPVSHAEQIRDLIERTAMSGGVEGVTSLIGGRRQVTLCRLVRERPDGADRFWLTTYRVDEMLMPGDEVVSEPAARGSLGEFADLTARELEVLALLGEGYGLPEIADRLCRARKTIDNHRTSLGAKLGRLSLTELVALASKSGLRVEDVNSGEGRRLPPAHTLRVAPRNDRAAGESGAA